MSAEGKRFRIIRALICHRRADCSRSVAMLSPTSREYSVETVNAPVLRVNSVASLRREDQVKGGMRSAPSELFQC